MKTLISFLRGINMTGYNSVKMKDLTELYKDLGFDNIETYIQSGNVIFSAPDEMSDEKVSGILKKGILDRFGYNIAVMVRTPEELKRLITSNPFLSDPAFDETKMAVIFLSERPLTENVNKFAGIDTTPDMFEISGREIFIYCPNGFGKTKLYANFFDRKLGVEGTTRNWKTINAMLDLAEKHKL
jgi:uncharacterized protein (DUF1697 family)